MKNSSASRRAKNISARGTNIASRPARALSTRKNRRGDVFRVVAAFRRVRRTRSQTTERSTRANVSTTGRLRTATRYRRKSRKNSTDVSLDAIYVSASVRITRRSRRRRNANSPSTRWNASTKRRSGASLKRRRSSALASKDSNASQKTYAAKRKTATVTRLAPTTINRNANRRIKRVRRLE